MSASNLLESQIAARWRAHPEALIYAYGTALVLAAVTLATGLVAAGVRTGPIWSVGALALLALYSERQSVELSPTIQLSVSFLPFVFAAVAFGPLAAMVVGAISLIGDFGRPHMRWVIWTSSRSIIGALAGLAAISFGADRAESFGLLLASVGAAAATEALADLVLGSVTPTLRGTGSFLSVSRATGPILMAAVPLYTPVIAVLVFAYQTISAWTVVLFLIPALAAQRLFILYREQRETAEQLASANERLKKKGISFASALVATLDARDRYTAGHSAAVAVYSRDIAKRMSLGEEQQQLVHLCGLVHDIGKIGLPAGLLEKPGPLTLEERRRMEEHSVIGERILAKVDDYLEIANVVRHHHERVDGQGYPDGLSGEEIPLLSRIIAVADAYNAMTSDRPYRDAMPSRVARLRLAQAVETQFDTTVVAAFEAILAAASDGYRSGNQAVFSVELQQQMPQAEDAA